MPTNNIKAIPLIPFNTAGLTPVFQPVNAPDGLPESIIILRLINDSGVNVIVSYDGVNDNEYLTPDTSVEFPFQANSLPNNKVAQLPKGTQIYVRGAAAGAGTFIVTGYYC